MNPVATYPETSKAMVQPLILAAASDSGSSAASFAQLLDDPKDGQRKTQKAQEHPAYSFGQLGMFGLHADVFRPDSGEASDNSVLPVSKPLATALAQSRNDEETTRNTATASLITIPFLEGDVLTDTWRIDAILSAQSSATPVSAGFAIVGTTHATSNSAKGTPERAAPATKGNMKPDLPQTRKPDSDVISITVTGPEEALQIAARSQAGTDVEVAKLRKVIENTVAEFEMDIAELRVNGQTTATEFSLGGGANGGIGR
ncbi:MAG: hypothetical protein WDM89_06880 [Rhizomicrobium sp.]